MNKINRTQTKDRGSYKDFGEEFLTGRPELNTDKQDLRR